MDLVEFRKRQAAYHDKTRKRAAERLSAGDDTPYFLALLEEMVMDLIGRVEELEEFLKPAPEEEVETFIGKRS